MTPADVAARAGISEGEASAFLAMLARQGRVRICVVALAGTRTPRREGAEPALST